MSKLVFSHELYLFIFKFNVRVCPYVGALYSHECHTETVPFTKICVLQVSLPVMARDNKEKCASE